MVVRSADMTIAEQPRKRARRMAEKEEKYVTWKAFLSIVISVTVSAVTFVISIGAAAWQVHSEHPHSGAVRSTEFERVIDAVNQLDEKVDGLATDVATIKARVKP